MAARQSARDRKQPGQLQICTAGGVWRRLPEQRCGQTRRATDAVREDFSRFSVCSAGDGSGGEFLSTSAKRPEDDGSGKCDSSERSEQPGDALAGLGLLRREGRATPESRELCPKG